MLSPAHRRSVAAVGLLVVFVVLTALPWRRYGSVKPSFDPNTLSYATHHTTAWTDSAWWLATAVLGVVAGISFTLRRGRFALVAAIAAATALVTWGVRARQVFRPRISARELTTLSSSSFGSRGPIQVAPHGQELASWLAAGILVLLLTVSAFRLLDKDISEVVSPSALLRSVGIVLVIGIAVLSFVPWYHYPAFDFTTYADRVGRTSAWTTFGIRDYWRLAAILGLLGALALMLRGRIAAVLGTAAGMAAVGCWLAGTWQLHHPIRHGTAYVITVVSGPLTSVDTNRPLSLTPPIRAGKTLGSDLALAVLILLVLISLVRLVILWRQRPQPVVDPASD